MDDIPVLRLQPDVVSVAHPRDECRTSTEGVLTPTHQARACIGPVMRIKHFQNPYEQRGFRNS